MKVTVSLLQCVQTIECDWSCRMVYLRPTFIYVY